MPTREDLDYIVDTFAIRSRFEIYIGDKQLTRDMLDSLRNALPALSHIYGTLEGYNPDIDFNYVLLSPDDLRYLTNRITKIAGLTKNVMEYYYLSNLFFAVARNDEEALRDVDPSNLIFVGTKNLTS